MDEFEVSQEQCYNEVLVFIDKLGSEGLIVVND
jgi:hypothetical protein